MKSSILTRFLLVTQALVLITCAVLDWTLTRWAGERERDAAARNAGAMARILAEDAGRMPAAGLAQWARGAARASGARVMLLGSNGSVLADSLGGGAAPAARALRQARDALQGDGSARVDRDPEGGTVTAAIAVRRAGGPAMVLHLEMAKAGDGLTASVQVRIVLAWLSCALLAAGLVWFASLPLIGRVRRLKQVAEGLLEIPPKGDEAGRGGDEMRALEHSLSGVAEQVRALVDKLRLESARREAILGSMAEGVLAVDGDLRIIFSNEAVSRAVGGSRKIQEKTRLLELIRDTGLLDTLREVIAAGGQRKHRLKITGDKERLFEVQAGPLEIPGGQGAMAILHDTTELERLEQVRKDFVANVSHEMRTPLAGIIGYSETLLDGALEDRENNRRFLQIIHSSAIRLNSIASDLLVLSELESKVDPPEAGRIPVRDVVESVLAIVENEASTRGVTLIREEIQDVHVMGTRLRLEQAVLNLVANAIKFNHPGGEVRIRAMAEPAGDVSITIADTGVGIPSQDLPRIFERFYRVDKGRSRQVGGTGLGLTIVKHVIERMNGTIEVQSQLRYGSTFTVRLPLATNAD